MIISPDEGSMNRAIYLANILGVDMGMYYKRLDYSKKSTDVIRSQLTNSLDQSLKASI